MQVGAHDSHDTDTHICCDSLESIALSQDSVLWVVNSHIADHDASQVGYYDADGYSLFKFPYQTAAEKVFAGDDGSVYITSLESDENGRDLKKYVAET